jgi:hypothetical protein
MYAVKSCSATVQPSTVLTFFIIKEALHTLVCSGLGVVQGDSAPVLRCKHVSTVCRSTTSVHSVLNQPWCCWLLRMGIMIPPEAPFLTAAISSAHCRQPQLQEPHHSIYRQIFIFHVFLELGKCCMCSWMCNSTRGVVCTAVTLPHVLVSIPVQPWSWYDSAKRASARPGSNAGPPRATSRPFPSQAPG